MLLCVLNHAILNNEPIKAAMIPVSVLQGKKLKQREKAAKGFGGTQLNQGSDGTAGAGQ